MRGLLLRWLLATLALYLTASFASNYVAVKSAPWAFLVVLILALLNAVVKPLLLVVKVITIPINMLTLGVFSLVLSLAVNVVFFWMLGGFGLLGSDFVVKQGPHGLAGAVVGGVLMSVINMFFSILIKDRE